MLAERVHQSHVRGFRSVGVAMASKAMDFMASWMSRKDAKNTSSTPNINAHLLRLTVNYFDHLYMFTKTFICISLKPTYCGYTTFELSTTPWVGNLLSECKVWWLTFGVTIIIYAGCFEFKCLWWII